MRKYIIPVGLLSVLLLFLSESCSLFQGRDEVIIGTEKTDTCRSNPEHTYEVYIPDIRNRCSEMPVLIIIDPHGNGKYALELFKAGADQHEFALFASNLLRNNYTEYIDGLNDLIEDIKGKYPVADKIYLAGFSGGGRMILNYARYFPAEGLIVSGALASAEELTAVKSPVFAIIGMDDFNFIEVAQYIFKPEAAPQNLRIEFTQASHSWPKPSLLSDALGYLELSVIKGSKCSEMKAQQKE